MTITSKSGFWDNNYSFLEGRNPLMRRVARVLNRRGMRDIRELMITLNGAAAGSAAAESYKRVVEPATPSANITERGGIRTIETKDLVARNTDADDITLINTYVLGFNPTPTLPSNGDKNPRSLNGG